MTGGKEKNIIVKEALKKEIYRHRILYLFLILAFAAVIVFAYIPMVGVLMSFQDYDIIKGLFGSEWVGLAHFREFLADSDFLACFEKHTCDKWSFHFNRIPSSYYAGYCNFLR